MKKPKPKKKSKHDDPFLKAAARYLERHGWTVLVIGGTGVHQHPGGFRFNYQLVINFTGKKRVAP